MESTTRVRTRSGIGWLGMLAVAVPALLILGAVAVPSAASAAVKTAAVSVINGNGQYVVGTQIKAGTYRSTNNASTYCSWSRLSNFSGSYKSVIASDFAKGPQIVTIAPGDKGFSTSDCGKWALLATLPVSPKTAIPAEGTFSVGRSIAAGTYVSTSKATMYCSWARLSGYSGTYSQTLAADFAKGPQIVTISASDRGFTTSGCGTWALLSKAPTARKTVIPGEGTFSVSKSITPGTYRSSNSGSTYCWWSKLSGFSGVYSQTTASGFAKGPQIVKITSSVAGFSTGSCGKWTRIGS